MKHTPGPWKVAGHGDGTGQLPILANGNIIAAIRDEGRLADALLISKAPELAAMLRRFVDGINDETYPLFWGGGLLSDDERTLLVQAEALLKKLDR